MQANAGASWDHFQLSSLSSEIVYQSSLASWKRYFAWRGIIIIIVPLRQRANCLIWAQSICRRRACVSAQEAYLPTAAIRSCLDHGCACSLVSYAEPSLFNTSFAVQ